MGSTVKGYVPGYLMPGSAGTFTLNNAQVVWTAVYIPAAVTLTGCKLIMATSGSYTATGYNGIALYSPNFGTGTLTQLVASTTSTTVWTAAPGWNTIPFSSTTAVAEGTYFIALVYQRSAEVTAPKIYTNNVATVFNSRDFTNNAKMVAVSSNTILPGDAGTFGYFSHINNTVSLPVLK